MKKFTSMVAAFLLVFGLGANAQIAAPTLETGKLMTAEELNASTGTKRIAIQLIHQGAADKGDWYFPAGSNTGHKSKDVTAFDETVVFEWIEKDGLHYLKKVTEGKFIGSGDIANFVEEADAQAILAVTPLPTGGSGNTATNWDQSCPAAADSYNSFICRLVKDDANDNWWINSNQPGWNQGTGVWTMFYVYDLTGHVAFSPIAGEKVTGLAPNSKVTTFCAPFATEIPADVQAYNVQAAAAGASSVSLVEIKGGIPANQGVVLVSQNDNAILPAAAEAVESLQSSVLKGSAQSSLVMNSGDYVLATVDGQTQFYAAKPNSVLKLNKAYMQMAGVQANSIKMNFGGEATAIEAVEAAADSNAPIYDLSGRKVSQMVKGGIYIQNGKKFVK